MIPTSFNVSWSNSSGINYIFLRGRQVQLLSNPWVESESTTVSNQSYKSKAKATNFSTTKFQWIIFFTGKRILNKKF